MRHLVKQFRDEKGLTQAKLARLLGVSEASVNNWERGKNRPTPSTLGLMAGQSSSALAAKLRTALDDYEWHTGGRGDLWQSAVRGFPAEFVARIDSLARNYGLDKEIILFEALKLGLAALSPRRLYLKALALRQAEAKRKAVEGTHGEREAKRIRPKIA